MRARTLRLLAAATGVLASVVVAPPTGSAAPGAATAASPLTVEVVGVDANGLDRAIAFAGAPHRAVATVQVTNAGDRTARNVITRVETGTSVAATEPVDLAPGQSLTRVLEVQISGLPGAGHDIAVTAGDATTTITHRQTPWLLAGAAAVGLHIAALAARDRLRLRVARAGGFERVQPSPSQTWARSSR